MTAFLNQEKGYIFRIVHRENLPIVLAGGLIAKNAAGSDPSYVNIGNLDLIGRRGSRAVPVRPGGVLNDYVPFYFTPYSPMAYNIKTGWGGIVRRNNEDILIFVSTVHHAIDCGLKTIFTDRHAYLAAARFFRDADSLNQIDWDLLRSKNFKKDAQNPERVERYQAEALIHDRVPLTGLRGIAVFNEQVREAVQKDVDKSGTPLLVRTMPSWYF
ncbi:type II toxin-antitoxin system toxin DNA ADP-ribosyl transferase DarT [Methylobacterium fujisawaense]|uniref:type II toxin-antitoxin system toxin DNA ADP-ribosyl transferase DarT n=1 Tax=Methylobacterium fujisawaense TaxID=107400 RepID=UPI00313D545A